MSQLNIKKSNHFVENSSELVNLTKKELIHHAENFSNQYRIGNGANFKLNDYETKASFNFKPLVLKN